MHAVVVEFAQNGNSSCAACSGGPACAGGRTPVATPEGTEREYTASFSGSDPSTCEGGAQHLPVGIRRSLARGA